jgi:DNA (cytosine-5)-methyltransferase 1
MKELSLFSGAGGGVLGTKLLGWEAIGYVEYNEYCQQVIAQRIEDGCLDNAPIFSDVNAFISEGYADAYKGMVGVISAGFPCQPFSVAGKKAAKDDPRNCWPQTLDIIRRVRPRYCLLENVGGLLSRKHRYFETILKDLAESGYDAWWKVISAAEVGAPHKRDRLWIVAYPNSTRELQSEGCEQDEWRRAGYGSQALADSNSGRSRQEEEVRSRRHTSEPSSEDATDTSSERLEGWEPPIGESTTHTPTGSTCWWDTEPRVGRVAHGMAHRVDRLKALGNGQVPAVVAAAFKVFDIL